MSSPLRLRAPGSKSSTQRALLIAALTEGQSQLVSPLDCDDSRALRGGLRALGVSIDEGEGLWSIEGGALHPAAAPIHCGDGGTTLRFLAPLCLLLPGELALQGSPRLRERPHGPLLSALAQLGVRAAPPGAGELFRLRAPSDGPVGGEVTVEASRSSQFASALLMVGPRLTGGLRLGLEGEVVSRPYLAMTLEVMASFGVTVEAAGGRLDVPQAPYGARRYEVEGDWSAAAFLLAAGAITGREVVVENVRASSLQGDRQILSFLEELRRPRPHRFDLTDCPDLLPPLAAACACASHRSQIEGVAHARVKESDRVAVLARGLVALGVAVSERPDGLEIEPAAALRSARLDPAGDHRMAMAFGLLSLRQPSLVVEEPGCVTKSFPDFWSVLPRFTAT